MWQKLGRLPSPQVFNHQACSWGTALSAGQAGVYRWGEAGRGEGQDRTGSKSGQAPKKISSLISHLCYLLSVSPQQVLLLCGALQELMGSFHVSPSASLPHRPTSSLKAAPQFSRLNGHKYSYSKRGSTFLSMKILHPRDERKTC